MIAKAKHTADLVPYLSQLLCFCGEILQGVRWLSDGNILVCTSPYAPIDDTAAAELRTQEGRFAFHFTPSTLRVSSTIAAACVRHADMCKPTRDVKMENEQVQQPRKFALPGCHPALLNLSMMTAACKLPRAQQ